MTTLPGRRLEIEQVGDVTLVRLRARSILTEPDAASVGHRLAELIDAPDCRKVVLDLGEVRSMTTMMAGQFLALHRRLQAVGGRLAICNSDRVLAEIFGVLGLTKVIRLYNSVQEALQSFA
jgi:anti-sigma B factor antagonist